jgi:phosphatidylinositol-bisphosphatase
MVASIISYPNPLVHSFVLLDKKKITISGNFIPTCFGSILSYLVRFPGPVRENKPLPPQSSECLSIPKELWRIADFIFKRAMDTV